MAIPCSLCLRVADMDVRGTWSPPPTGIRTMSLCNACAARVAHQAIFHLRVERLLDFPRDSDPDTYDLLTLVIPKLNQEALCTPECKGLVPRKEFMSMSDRGHAMEDGNG